MASNFFLVLCAAILCCFAANCGGRTFSSSAPAADDDASPTADDDSSPSEFFPPDEWGPYGVGVRRMLLIDESRGGRHVPVLLYYPALVAPITEDRWLAATQDAGLQERLQGASFCATPDAAPDWRGAPYPVLAFSHGSGADKELYKYYHEYLASHGYICVAADHVGNDKLLQYWPWDMSESVKRPFDISFALDKVLSEFAAGPNAGFGDANRVGMAGHSYGGNTTLALVGATFNYDFIAAQCKLHPIPDPWTCAIVGARKTMEAGLPDRRIKAAMTLATDGAQSYFGPNCVGGATVQLPVLLVGGTRDTICPYKDNDLPCFATFAGPKYLLVVKGGGHIGLSDAFEDGTIAFRRHHALVQRYAVAFFGYHLKGVAEYADYLGAAAAANWNAGHDDFVWAAQPGR